MRRIIALILFTLVLFGLNEVRTVVSGPQEQRLSMPQFQKGYSYLLYGFTDLDKKDYWFQKKTVELYNHLENQHVNAISIVFPFTQDGFSANSVRTDGVITPPNETLSTAIRQAHKRNMVVVLRPILDESDFNDAKGEWRGVIKPTDTKGWMASYTGMMVDYAVFAEEEKVEVLAIGTELSSMLAEEEEWMSLITQVREVYKGKIIYSFNWDDTVRPSFVSQLDYIGIDSFYPVQEPIVTAWEPWIAKMAEYEAFSNKPVIFTELGTRSQVDSYKSPWGWKTSAPVDQEAQVQYYDSLCQASTGVVDGWYIWYVTVNSLDINPKVDQTFDPTRKKAEQSISTCYGSI